MLMKVSASDVHLSTVPLPLPRITQDGGGWEMALLGITLLSSQPIFASALSLRAIPNIVPGLCAVSNRLRLLLAFRLRPQACCISLIVAIRYDGDAPALSSNWTLCGEVLREATEIVT